MKTLVHTAVLFGVLVVSPFLFATELQLNFSGGGSSESPQEGSVDAYPGMAGQGWSGPWLSIDQPKRVSLDVKVEDEKPFKDGDAQYLQVRFEDLQGAVSVTAGVSRAVSDNPSNGGIDFSKPYEIRLQFRLGEVSEPFTTPNDRISVSGGPVILAEESRSEVADAWNVSFRPQLGWIARVGAEKKVSRFGPKDIAINPDEIWTIKLSFRPETARFDVVLESSAGTQIEGLDQQMAPFSPQSPPAMISVLIGRQGEGKRAVLDVDNVEIRQQ